MGGQTEATVNKQEKFSLKKAIGYSSYQSSSIANSLLISYLTYYATDSLLLSAASIGMVMAFSRVFDGVTDIIAGALIDRTNTKIGRARPYLFCGIAAYIAMIAMFSTPDLPDTGKLVWIFITYNLNSSIFATFYGICGPTLMKRTIVDSNNRVKTLGISGIFTNIASTVVNVVLPIIVAMADGDAKYWTYLAVGMGAVGVLLILLAFFFCKEYTEEEMIAYGVLKQEDAENKKKIGIKEMALSIVKNEYFLIYLFIYLLNSFYLGISYAVQVYYYSANLGNIGLMSSVSMLLIITWPLNLVYPKIVSKIGSAGFAQMFLILGAVGSLARIFVGGNVILLAITGFMSSMVTGGISFIGAELTIQCMEYSYLKNGIQAESIYNSFLNFAMKVGMGIGAAILGIVLTRFGYDGALTVQPDSALSAINFMFNIFPAIVAAIMYIGLKFCKVEEANKKLRNQ